MKVEKDFARKLDGSPQGHASFESVTARIKEQVRREGGFPRPMLNMDVEEARSGWNNPDRAFTTATTDRWKGGVFDSVSTEGGPVKYRPKGISESLKTDMTKYSRMRPGVERVTNNPEAMVSNQGVRAGSTVAIKAPDPRMGPGSYNVTNHEIRTSTAPLKIKGVKSSPNRPDASDMGIGEPASFPFNQTVPRDFTNMHPSFICGGVSPNTLNMERQSAAPSNYKLGVDSSHWFRQGTGGAISRYEAPSSLTAKTAKTPGPGHYHTSTTFWEDTSPTMRKSPGKRAMTTPSPGKRSRSVVSHSIKSAFGR